MKFEANHKARSHGLVVNAEDSRPRFVGSDPEGTKILV